jgi:tRNA pseudouridine38-40 synthase
MTHGERKIRLLIAYDGTAYRGWQRQKEDPTLQGTIERVLQKITGHPLSLIGAGRTDAGVHAWGQVAHFQTRSTLPPERFKTALNALLPKDILIRAAEEAAADFHARYSAKAKVYDYWVLVGPSAPPFLRNYVWVLEKAPDWERIGRGLALLLGKRDFSSFQTQGSRVSHPVRTLFQASLLPVPWGGIRFRFKADGFLRHMVRNLVGTLVRLGTGRISLEEFQEILEAKDRSRAAASAPAKGLYLRKVFY